MEAGQRIVRMLPDQGREGRHRRDVVGLQFGECFAVLPRRRGLEDGRRQGLVGPQRLAAAAQHEIADRPPAEVFRPLRRSRAHADAGAEILVGGLQPRRDIDRIAIGCVIEKPITSEVSDQRRPGMDADPGRAKIDPLGFPALAKCLAPTHRVRARRRWRVSHNPADRRAH